VDLTVTGACIGKQRKPPRTVALVVWEEKNVKLETVQENMAMNYARVVLLFLATHFCKVMNVCKNDTTTNQSVYTFMNFRNFGASPPVKR
jgi:hypothetical protein